MSGGMFSLMGNEHFRWIRGMFFDDGFGNKCCVASIHQSQAMNKAGTHGILDLDDPATIGCLTALAREACGIDALHIQWSIGFRPNHPDGDWRVHRVPIDIAGKTEGEAAVQAILLAPKKGDES